MLIGLTIILLLVLFLPFTHFVEKFRDLSLYHGSRCCVCERSLFMGACWGAAVHPINITIAVLVAGDCF